ncbi:hypothetical protein ScalyP_jg5613 [Parmales sp. scaly parma]|nr:hypothetical protein ScalyP_jg5613 [Parmales sp. scaly parma]
MYPLAHPLGLETETTIILFYHYTPLGTPSEMAIYASLQTSLLTSLNLTGRLLIGCGPSEGLNGTLAGSPSSISTYTSLLSLSPPPPPFASFFLSHPSIPPFSIPPSSFKYSSHINININKNINDNNLFPDLHIRVVKEIISSGGKFSHIPQSSLSTGLLSPSEFHSQVSSMLPTTQLIDCRNSKEVAIGTFRSATNPKTRTFAEFGTWVDNNKADLIKKDKILMYCTGGIRCEKASAYVREVTNKPVFHLRGGIHKYLEEFDSTNEGLFEIQRDELLTLYEDIRTGKKFRARRKTLSRQIEKLEVAMAAGCEKSEINHIVCRSCGEPKSVCNGSCWGFFGLNRLDKSKTKSKTPATATKRRQQPQQRQKSKKERNEIEITPPHRFLDAGSSLRTPLPIFRTLACSVKARHCGRTVREVILSEFFVCGDDSTNCAAIEKGLITVNNTQTNVGYVLKNGDSIERVVHWHEPPVKVGQRIEVRRVMLTVEGEEREVFCCNKPCTVPTHPGGPYYSNSLTCMVEAQENLSPHALKPCHRLDRVTSGLLVCCVDGKVAKFIQNRMETGRVKKYYLARVSGKFLEEPLTVDMPIFIDDLKAGIRTVDVRGKESKTVFRMIKFDGNFSLVLCEPVTGRGHQIRVHLQSLGFPIVGDTQYGGVSYEGEGANTKLGVACVERSAILKDVASEQEKKAVEFCDCCVKGPEAAYSTAQLLGDGCMIDLNAFRYDVDVGSGVTLSFKVECAEFAKDFFGEKMRLEEAIGNFITEKKKI